MLGIIYDDVVLGVVFKVGIILFVVIGIIFAFVIHKIIKDIVGDLKGDEKLHKIVDTRKDIQKIIGLFLRIELTIIGVFASYYFNFLFMLILALEYGLSDIPCLLGFLIIPLLIFPQIWVKKKKRLYAFLIWVSFIALCVLLAIFLKI